MTWAKFSVLSTLMVAASAAASPAEDCISVNAFDLNAFGNLEASRASRPFLDQAIKSACRGYLAERNGDFPRALSFYNDARDAAIEANMAFSTRHVEHADVSTHVNFVSGVVRLDIVRLRHIVGYRPRHTAADILDGDEILMVLALDDLQAALRSAQRDLELLKDGDPSIDPLRREINAIRAAIGYAHLLQGDNTLAAQEFYQLPSSDPIYSAPRRAADAIRTKQIGDGIRVGAEVIKMFLPKWASVISALVTFVSDFRPDLQ